jgi:hypothetical protein
MLMPLGAPLPSPPWKHQPPVHCFVASWQSMAKPDRLAHHVTKTSTSELTLQGVALSSTLRGGMGWSSPDARSRFKCCHQHYRVLHSLQSLSNSGDRLARLTEHPPAPTYVMVYSCRQHLQVVSHSNIIVPREYKTA